LRVFQQPLKGALRTDCFMKRTSVVRAFLRSRRSREARRQKAVSPDGRFLVRLSKFAPWRDQCSSSLLPPQKTSFFGRFWRRIPPTVTAPPLRGIISPEMAYFAIMAPKRISLMPAGCSGTMAIPITRARNWCACTRRRFGPGSSLPGAAPSALWAYTTVLRGRWWPMGWPREK